MKLKYDTVFDIGIGRWTEYSLVYPNEIGYTYYNYAKTKRYSISSGAWLFGVYDTPSARSIEISNFAWKVSKRFYIDCNAVELKMFHTHTIAMGINNINLLHSSTIYLAFETTKPNFHYILLK